MKTGEEDTSLKDKWEEDKKTPELVLHEKGKEIFSWKQSLFRVSALLLSERPKRMQEVQISRLLHKAKPFRSKEMVQKSPRLVQIKSFFIISM